MKNKTKKLQVIRLHFSTLGHVTQTTETHSECLAPPTMRSARNVTPARRMATISVARPGRFRQNSCKIDQKKFEKISLGKGCLVATQNFLVVFKFFENPGRKTGRFWNFLPGR